MVFTTSAVGQRIQVTVRNTTTGTEKEKEWSVRRSAGPCILKTKFSLSLYEALYNSAASEVKMNEILTSIDEMLDCRAEGEVRRVTARVVAAACRRMKSGS